MKAVVVDVLLGVGVGSILLSCLGLLASGGPFEQLHFTGPAATIAPVAIAAAVIVDESTPSSMAVKSVITAVILLVTSPVLVHATAHEEVAAGVAPVGARLAINEGQHRLPGDR